MFYQVKRENLGDRVGFIAPASYKGHTVNSFVGGIIPIKVATNFTQEEWDRFCNGEYNTDDMIKFKMMGKFI